MAGQNSVLGSNSILRLAAQGRRFFMLGWPIFGLIALIGASGFYLLSDIARHQDRTYEQTTQKFVTQAIDATLQANASISTDYSLWSDAYENATLSNNLDWMEANIVTTNASALAVYRPGTGTRFLFSNEKFNNARTHITAFLSTLDYGQHSTYVSDPSHVKVKAAPNRMMLIDGKLAAVAMQPIRPTDNFDGLRPTPGQVTDYLVSISFVDESAIAAIGKSFGLANPVLSIANGQHRHDPKQLHVDLKDPKGEVLAALSWDNERPGTRAFSQRLMPITVGLLILGLIAIAVTQHLVSRQMRFLSQARKSAEEANKTKSSFLANVSHELRTPLNAIIGYSEIIGEDAAYSGQTGMASDAKKVTSAANHLLALINDLLDHSKIEAGKMDLNLTEVKLAPIFEEVAEALDGAVKKNGSSLVVNVDPTIGNAILDGMRFKQCLLNLISNAAKFTQNGTITLSARPVDQGGVPFIRVSVKDSGIGMSEATVAKLFAPFVQADTATATRYGGTGLGLVITRALIEAMGGTVDVESAVGIGSTFTILVPRGHPVDKASDKASGASQTKQAKAA